jgi:hypothetical protein
LFVPSDSVILYAFFEPDLPSCDCSKQGFEADWRSVIVAFSPYAPPTEVTSDLTRLRGDGRKLLQETTAGGTRILYFGPRGTSGP